MHAICRPRSPKKVRRNQHYMANHIRQKNCEKMRYSKNVVGLWISASTWPQGTSRVHKEPKKRGNFEEP